MTKTILSCWCLILCISSLRAQNETLTYEFRHGNWFDGKGFAPATWYTAGGKLTNKQPAKVDSVIDLAGRWVVPPLADAFCSSVSEASAIEQQLKSYIDEGIFYLQILGNTQEGRKKTEPLACRQNTPDAVFSNGSFTCTLGYPFLLYEGPAQGIRNPGMMAQNYAQIREERKMLGDGYWFVDGKTALDAIWKKVAAQRPDVISIYLLDAENSGGKETKGLSPDVAKAVIKKAHRSGLRVFAHVETAADLRLGIKLGVDGFANLPGYNWDGVGDAKRYELTEDDLRKLAKKKTPVIPLFSHAMTQTPRPGAQQEQAKLFRRLLQNGVNVVIGSDDPQRTIRAEVNYWFQFADLDYAQALQILCVNTPQAIFPKRKIGRFEEGYEANFLVLSDNPLQNLLKLRAIAYRVKGGVFIK
ncbi:MAG: amidohydrolase family protein [Saprospirales bacterium]|nr:amidohydrolase family protein [Saprospirales bacterium]